MPTQSPPKKIILLVEDDFHINSIYSIFLENEGYRVTSAHDAQEAENFLAKESFDLVLLDIMLPDKSGLDILRDMKKASTTSHIPVIIMTNIEDQDIVNQAEKLGVNKYLVKARTSIHDLAREARTFLEVIETAW